MSRRRAECDAKHANRSSRLKERLDRGSLADAAPADRAACLSQRLWAELIASAALGCASTGVEPATASEAKALRTFYHHAVMADVAREHVTDAAARAYLRDKWTSRCDKMCCALLCLAERSNWLLPLPHSDEAEQGVLRVASVGGGPGNDAWGAFLFSAFARNWRLVEANVFDFSPVWRPFCEASGTAHILSSASQLLSLETGSAPEMSLCFQEADLRAPTDAAVNRILLSTAPATQLFLFSHVVRESQACQHALLPALLRRSRRGAVFVFLDMCWADLDRVHALVTRVEEEDATRRGAVAGEEGTKEGEHAGGEEGVRFEILRLGESQVYPFFGLAFRTRSEEGGASEEQTERAREREEEQATECARERAENE
mmetsp:Transcript_19657/g.46927  ORF Transcript_19657/g.46927 Transcript_19657/m.46927 type:complete len:374 (-) Transcript_19657:21-1142(-)